MGNIKIWDNVYYYDFKIWKDWFDRLKYIKKWKVQDIVIGEIGWLIWYKIWWSQVAKDRVLWDRDGVIKEITNIVADLIAPIEIEDLDQWLITQLNKKFNPFYR